ncbi:MAG: hypothetical protein QF464_12575, partial [Myxococcota bacterium]|nr:hypothetical protein [Myxococcota bacterium]
MKTALIPLRTLLLAAGLALALPYAACDAGDASGTGGVCDPGETQNCVCPDDTGAQSCNDTGTGWEPCVCTGGGVGGGGGDATAPGDAVDQPDAVVTPKEDVAGPTSDTLGPDVTTSDVQACVPYCVGKVPYSCDDEGQAVAAAPCADDFHCSLGTCAPCEGVAGTTCEGDKVVSFDACGEVVAELEDCTLVGYCSGGECVEACIPQHDKRCVGNDVYWFDSCGAEGGPAEVCADDEFCDGCQPEDAACSKEGQCVKAVLTGTWHVTADPDTKDACGMGPATFLPVMMDLQVDGTTVTGHADVLDFSIDYVGTLEGKHLTMTGTYSESETILGQTITIEQTGGLTFEDALAYRKGKEPGKGGRPKKSFTLVVG